jgi:DNA-binding MarR family transcriptional regulator
VSKFDHTEIDDVIHGRLRLGIMAYLSTVSTHLSKLEEAEYVRLEKTSSGRKPLTLVHLTKQGRAAWIAYLNRIQALLSAAE